MPIEVESPEEFGYGKIVHNLAESSVTNAVLGDLDLSLDDVVVAYGDHRRKPELGEMLAADGDGLRPDGVLLTVGAAAAPDLPVGVDRFYRVLNHGGAHRSEAEEATT